MAAYGPQGIVRGPASGPGWPRKGTSGVINADTTGFPAQYVIVRSNQSVRIPSWATYARIGATGRGGDGGVAASLAGGGGGGGFAGTNTVKAQPGGLINVRFDAVGTVIEGIGYQLIGGNGSAPAGTGFVGSGGVGSGGDVNFTGGAGGGATSTGGGGGGGAAGRGGAGSVGGSSTTSTGGAGGNGSAGVGYLSGASGGGSSSNSSGSRGTNPVTTAMGAVLITVGQDGKGASVSDVGGGDGGGGAAGQAAATFPSLGGSGFALIEFW